MATEKVATQTFLIGLVGNPNVGKTSLFNVLTGSNQKVGNYAGVTVEKHSGSFNLENGVTCEIVDIPGLYSMNPMSMDETIATDAIRGVAAGERRADLMICAVDATSIERNLFFFSQLVEVGIPLIVVLTMTDVLDRKGFDLDVEALRARLGVPVVPVISHRMRGISLLKQEIQKVLANGQEMPNFDHPTLEARYAWSAEIDQAVIKENPAKKLRAKTDKIDYWLTHRVFGLLIFVGVMYVLFQSVYTFAQPVMGWVEMAFGWIGDQASKPLAGAPDWVQSLIVDGIISGIGSVAVFLPQILILFFFIAALEGTGYLSRASFLMDRLLGWCGLNGKAFIPLLSSFACAIPGIMAARIMPDPRSRLTTILVAPLMSCSARLPVYVLLIGVVIEPRFGAAAAGLSLFLMHTVGLVIAIPMILILNRKILRGTKLPFVMELPPYQVPKWRDVWGAMYGRAKIFVKTAGTVIIVMSVLIWALLYFPRSDSALKGYEQEYTQANPTATEDQIERHVDARQLENSYLGKFGKGIEPIFKPAGFDWRISTAILCAFPAREVLVSSLGIIFDLGADQDESSVDLRESLKRATWPDGKPLLTTASAIALMIFFALCCQCGATLAAIKRETNTWRWPVFVFFYMTFLAWACAVGTYQLLTALRL